MKPRAWRNLMAIPESEEQPVMFDDYIPPVSTSNISTVAPSTTIKDPVIPVVYIDPVISTALDTISTNTGGDIPAMIDPASYKIPKYETPAPETPAPLTTVKETATNVVNDVTNSIKEIFAGSDQSAEDNTGLYLAGAVVVIGLLALLFKK